ncbi:MAG: hypothetical protein AB7F79_00415 [Steroidobacteraceae bacterium]
MVCVFGAAIFIAAPLLPALGLRNGDNRAIIYWHGFRYANNYN